MVTARGECDNIHALQSYKETLDCILFAQSSVDMDVEEFLKKTSVSGLSLDLQARLVADIRKIVDGGNTVYFHNGKKRKLYTDLGDV